MTVHTGSLRRFLWDGATAVVSVEHDDGSKVALLVHGPVAESFIARQISESGEVNLEVIIGLRVVCEESSRGIVTKLALDAASREREGTA